MKSFEDLLLSSAKAHGHIEAGAKKVILSAPGKGEVKTIAFHDLVCGTDKP